MQQVQIIRPDGRTIVVGGAAQGPRSAAELRAIQAQREEIRAQVDRLEARKAAIRAERERAPSRSALQASLDAQIAELDARQATLDARLDQLNERILEADPRALVGTTMPPRDPIGERIADKIIPLTAILSVFVLLPLALAFARLLWKKGTSVGQRPAANEQLVVSRLEQLQTAVDTMALEVERISEGQRYVTKVLAEREKTALPR